MKSRNWKKEYHLAMSRVSEAVRLLDPIIREIGSRGEHVTLFQADWRLDYQHDVQLTIRELRDIFRFYNDNSVTCQAYRGKALPPEYDDYSAPAVVRRSLKEVDALVGNSNASGSEVPTLSPTLKTEIGENPMKTGVICEK